MLKPRSDRTAELFLELKLLRLLTRRRDLITRTRREMRASAARSCEVRASAARPCELNGLRLRLRASRMPSPSRRRHVKLIRALRVGALRVVKILNSKR